MEEVSPEIVARRDLYLDLNSIDVEKLLGRGLDGIVWYGIYFRDAHARNISLRP